MSNIPVEERKKAREVVERAVEKSIRESPAPVQKIAEQTGYHPSFVHRVYRAMGWRFEGGRWVWRHNPPKDE